MEFLVSDLILGMFCFSFLFCCLGWCDGDACG
jgi:hypothetical protein